MNIQLGNKNNTFKRNDESVTNLEIILIAVKLELNVSKLQKNII